MSSLFLMMAGCLVLAYIIQSCTYNGETVRQTFRRDIFTRFLYYVLLAVMILFAGLRTTYNDTATYMQGFEMLETEKITFSMLFEPYGGFTVLQQYIKQHLGDDPQKLILVTSAIINILFMAFITRHSKNFTLSVFLYLIGNYMFSLGGIKQAIAMAISLIAIECMMKRKYIWAALFLLLAVTFHPYIICIAVLPFLRKKTWNLQTFLVILIVIILVANIDNLLDIIARYGKEYSMDELTNNTINPLRVAIEAIPIVIIMVFRNSYNLQEDEWLNLGLNMMTISFLFIAIGLFYNPIYFGRIGSYFGVISMVITPIMLDIAGGSARGGKLFKLAYYLLFTLYFLLDLTKLGTIGLSTDLFNHISFFSLF